MAETKNWTVMSWYQDGAPRSRELVLDKGCTLSLHDVPHICEQKAVLKLQLNGVNYETAFTRPLPDARDEDQAREWAEQTAWENLMALKLLTDAAQRGLLDVDRKKKGKSDGKDE